eukprot:symbB.v1.2.004920.t2/scaffold281.1/size241006/1
MAAMAFSLGEKVLYEDSKAYQHIMFVYPTRVDQHYQITKSLFEPPNPPDYWVPESRLQGLVVKNPSWAQGQIEAATSAATATSENPDWWANKMWQARTERSAWNDWCRPFPAIFPFTVAWTT